MGAVLGVLYWASLVQELVRRYEVGLKQCDYTADSDEMIIAKITPEGLNGEPISHLSMSVYHDCGCRVGVSNSAAAVTR